MLILVGRESTVESSERGPGSRRAPECGQLGCYLLKLGWELAKLPFGHPLPSLLCPRGLKVSTTELTPGGGLSKPDPRVSKLSPQKSSDMASTTRVVSEQMPECSRRRDPQTC